MRSYRLETFLNQLQKVKAVQVGCFTQHEGVLDQIYTCPQIGYVHIQQHKTAPFNKFSVIQTKHGFDTHRHGNQQSFLSLEILVSKPEIPGFKNLKSVTNLKYTRPVHIWHEHADILLWSFYGITEYRLVIFMEYFSGYRFFP